MKVCAIPRRSNAMVFLMTTVVSSGANFAHGQPIECEDYSSGTVEPFFRLDISDWSCYGGTSRYRIYGSYYSEPGYVSYSDRLYDASDPTHPVIVAEGGGGGDTNYNCPIGGGISSFWDNRFLSTSISECHYNASLFEVDLENNLTYLPLPFGHIMGNGQYVWVDVNFEYGLPLGLRLYDVENLAAATEITPPAGMVMPSIVLDDMALQHEGETWTVVDLLDPAGPMLRGSFHLTGDPEGPNNGVMGVASGNVIYLMFWDYPDATLYTLDVSDRDRPAVLDSLPLPTFGDFVANDGLLYHVTRYNFSIYDVSDPSHVTLLAGPIGNGENCYQVLPRGHLLYVRYLNALSVYNILDPANPVLVGTSILEHVDRNSSGTNHLHAADGWLVSGPYFFHYDCDDPLSIDHPDTQPGATDPAELVLDLTSLTINGDTHGVSFTLDRPCPVELSVYDPLGRCVAVLHSGPLPAGPHIRPWDGRDDSGRRQPAGVYLARLQAEDRVATCKLLLLR
ncbi:MAG: hypothetical protein C0395_10230 [Gemmatimonas sp.]|nr:hypothetical protein [Gemmatimonas sp.]